MRINDNIANKNTSFVDELLSNAFALTRNSGLLW